MANPFNYYPATYQPQMYPYQSISNPQPMQNGGFVSVRSEDEARNYPVAPGNSVTFKNEVEPYVYTKTKNAEPFGEPVFTKYKLVKEEPQNAPKTDEPTRGIDLSAYALKTDLDAIRADFGALRDELTKKGKKEDE